jgi:Glycosyltransferase family 87
MRPKLSKTLLILLFIAFFLAIYLIRIRGDMVDFRVNYQAGERLRAGENLYRTEDGHFMFKYLPFSALLYLPLSFLPLEVAKAIWYGALVASAVAMFYLSNRIALGAEKSRRATWVLPPLILAKFCFREMKLGQINLIVMLVLLFMVRTLIASRRTPGWRQRLRAGWLWGLGTSLKPYGSIFLPYLLVGKEWMALASGVAAIFISLLIPALFYGWAGNLLVLRDWAATLSQSTPTLFTSNDNISIIACLMKWTGNLRLSMTLTAALVGLLAVLMLAMIFIGKKVEEPVGLESALLLTLIPLISPLGWDYTLLMSVLAVTFIVKHFFDYPPWLRVVLVLNFCVISLSIYDVIGGNLYGAFMSHSILTINFLLIVGLIAHLRFRRLA